MTSVHSRRSARRIAIVTLLAPSSAMGDAIAALEAAKAVRDELTQAHAKIKTLEARLLAMQRAASESQRLAAEAQEALELTRKELAAATAGEAETRAAARAEAAAQEVAAEKERFAAAEKAHAVALAAARAESSTAVAPLKAAAAAAAAEAARERERCAELQRSVEPLTRAGEEAKELWARLKEALLVRPARCAGAATPEGPAAHAARARRPIMREALTRTTTDRRRTCARRRPAR